MKKYRIIDLLDIEALEVVSGDEATKIAQNWLAAFCPTKRSFKGIKRFKTYMWDLMNCDLEKEDAFIEYDKLEAAKYIIMEDCFGQDEKEVYVVEKKPSSNDKLKDFHVFPNNLAWSMAFTHEDGWVGPKLAKHRDFDKLNTKNKRAIEAISRIYD